MPTLLLEPATNTPADAAARPPKPPGSRLSASSSLLLDAVRFTAALAVLLHHFTDSQMSAGWPHLGVLGHEAVCVFFVLSGFVIRLVTTSRQATRSATLTQYAIDRASRIYSVVAPALLATLICELLAAAIHPAAYGVMRDGFAWRDVPLQLLANLTFTAQAWGYGHNPLSNAPFWSLSYEVLYYALYGVIQYRVRGRWWIVALGLVISGPSIAALFPIWLLGALTCDVYLKLSPGAMACAGPALPLRSLPPRSSRCGAPLPVCCAPSAMRTARSGSRLTWPRTCPGGKRSPGFSSTPPDTFRGLGKPVSASRSSARSPPRSCSSACYCWTATRPICRRA